MTEAKSPREIAEEILNGASIMTYQHVSRADGTASEQEYKPREQLLAEIEQALLSYAAERERLLDSRTAALQRIANLPADARTGRPQRIAMAALGAKREIVAIRLRSRPATEGKGD